MPDIDSLLEKASKKKFKKSSYRPWNYMEEIQKEEQQQEHKIDSSNVSIEEDSTPNVELSKVTETVNVPKYATPQSERTQVQSSINESNKIVSATSANQKEQTNSPLYIILRLSGHQKTIFNFILERCVTRGLLSTGSVTSETLTSITNTSLTMVNTSIQRLVEKKIIHRENGKRGRGGFYSFGISQEIKDAAVEYRRLTNFDAVESFDNQTTK